MIFIYFENDIFKELAYVIYYSLIEYNIKSKVINYLTNDNYKGNEESLYIILGMNDYHSDIVPKKYIVYQLEQATAYKEHNWFHEDYVNYLYNALYIWDYSQTNIDKLKELFPLIDPDKYIYMPILYHSNYKEQSNENENEVTNKEIDILFIGYLNDRRKKIINTLTDHYKDKIKINICSNKFDEELESYIKKSKIVLNIHAYNNSILETIRINSILSNSINNNYNTIILSETSKSKELDDYYKDYIYFYDNELINQVDYILSNYEDIYNKTNNSLSKYQDIKYVNNFKQCIEQLNNYNINNKDDNEINYDEINYDKINYDEIEDINSTKSISDIPKINLTRELYDNLPYISLITVTYNRKQIFRNAINNYNESIYPKDKIEWIIVDDSESKLEDLTDILPKNDNIKYHKLVTTGRLYIGQKRNYAIEQASHDIIVFMDDDDYYFPESILNRVQILMNNPEYDMVGVKDLFIHDMNSNSSLLAKGKTISEASMAFRKSMYKEKPFPEKFKRLGEGHTFTKGRLNKVITIPSYYVIIAITHKTNYTGQERSGSSAVNLLDSIPLKRRLNIYKLLGNKNEDSDEE